MTFAKLFETEDMGQILVMVGQSHECMPEVRTWVQPAGLAPCSIAIGFDDSVEGERLANDLFEAIDTATARRTATAIIDAANGKLPFHLGGEPSA